MKRFPTCGRMIAAVLTVILLCAPMSGCTTKYDRRDVEKYISDKYGIEGFQVSRESKEVTNDKDRYTDYLWTVTEDDGTVFYVLDDYYWGTEWVTNSLTDNRNTVRLRKYLSTVQLPGFSVKDYTPRSSYIDFITLVGSFSSRAELLERFEALDRLAADMPEGLSASYQLEYSHKYRIIGEYTDSTGDCSGKINSGDKSNTAEAEKNLLHCALDLRYEDVIAEYTESEISDLIKERYVFAIGVRRDDGTIDYYGDLIESRFYYGISFPSMYEVLARCGYAVEGDKDRFSFVGIDGSEYEFSNDFRENEWYYYKMDGENVPMDVYFYNHLNIGRIEKMTGIPAIDGYYASREPQGNANGQGMIVSPGDTGHGGAAPGDPPGGM